MTVLKDFFTSLKWWKLVPDLGLFGPDNTRGRAAAISEDGDFAVVYFTSRMELSIHIGKLGGSVRAVWVDPTSGRRVRETAAKGEVYRFSSPPCCDDALLLLLKR
jgi:hypothetical protein